MFGTNNHQSADDPAMLDNVKQLASQPADQVVPQQPAMAAPDAGAGGNFAFQSLQPVADNTPPPAPQPATMPGMQPTPQPQLSTYAPPQILTNDNTPTAPVATPMFSQPAPTQDQTQAQAIAPVDDSSTVPPVDHDKLADMKQEALGHLEPLVAHLEQNPEEEFKTTMMMIQANDNHTLLDKALIAARKIQDDKKRAEALLDIINEINYFSQNQQN